MEEVGKLSSIIKELLNIETNTSKIMKSDGFEIHLRKRKHDNMFIYLKYIQEIISNPDYVGMNPREKGTSLEFIKILDDNILLAIKLDTKKDYFYLATMHEISALKLEQRLKNGRLKKL